MAISNDKWRRSTPPPGSLKTRSAYPPSNCGPRSVPKLTQTFGTKRPGNITTVGVYREGIAAEDATPTFDYFHKILSDPAEGYERLVNKIIAGAGCKTRRAGSQPDRTGSVRASGIQLMQMCTRGVANGGGCESNGDLFSPERVTRSKGGLARARSHVPGAVRPAAVAHGASPQTRRWQHPISCPFPPARRVNVSLLVVQSNCFSCVFLEGWKQGDRETRRARRG